MSETVAGRSPLPLDDAGGQSVAQPLLGLLGLVIAGTLFALLALVPGTTTSLQVLGPLTTFALPVLVASVRWWDGWPFPAERLGRGGAALLNTLLIAAAAVLLTLLGQAIAGRAGVDELFRTAAATPGGAFVPFPWTMPLAAFVFVAMLQLSYVNDKAVLDRLGPRVGGLAAIAVSWAVGVAGYLLLANWDAIPAPFAGLIGLSNPNGPIDALDLVAILIAIAVWQVLLFVLLDGKPFAGIRAKVPRLVVANTVTLAIGILWYLLAHDVLDWSGPRISAVSSCVIGAVFLAGLLFEGWPARHASSAGSVVLGLIATVGVLAAGLYFGLQALGKAAGDWTPESPVELWTAVSALNYVAGAIVLTCGVWGRWPFTARGR